MTNSMGFISLRTQSVSNIMFPLLKRKGWKKVKETQGKKDLAGIHSRPAGAPSGLLPLGEDKRLSLNAVNDFPHL